MPRKLAVPLEESTSKEAQRLRLAEDSKSISFCKGSCKIDQSTTNIVERYFTDPRYVPSFLPFPMKPLSNSIPANVPFLPSISPIYLMIPSCPIEGILTAVPISGCQSGGIAVCPSSSASGCPGVLGSPDCRDSGLTGVRALFVPRTEGRLLGAAVGVLWLMA
jgi:hypothetical protein